jgi:tetratricopeptide (TPR) repeat protein
MIQAMLSPSDFRPAFCLDWFKRPTFQPALLMLLALSLIACRTPPRAIVPVQPSAVEQYTYAQNYKHMRNLELIPKDQNERYLKTREIVRQHFAKVVDYFPGDRSKTGTPLAKLELLEMQAGLDSVRAPVSKRQIRAAIKGFQQLLADYPDPELDFIKAKSLYDQGMCYKRMGKYEAAQACFYNVKQEFANNDNARIKDLAKKAEVYYNKTEIE